MKSFVIVAIIGLGVSLSACKKGEEGASKTTGKELSSRAKAQKEVVFEIVDKYFEEKGTEQVEKALEAIIAKRRQGPSMEERMSKRTPVDIAGAPVKGDPNAIITIVEFSDFSCPFCSRVNPTIEEVMKTYAGKVKLAFRHKPLPIHPQARPIHLGSMAAQEQGKFWEFYNRAFKGQEEVQKASEAKFKTKKPGSREEMEKGMDEVGKTAARKWAQELKLDIAKFDADVKKAEFMSRLDSDIEFADKNGPGGTPSFFINGVQVVGAVPVEEFKKVIDALLAEKK